MIISVPASARSVWLARPSTTVAMTLNALIPDSNSCLLFPNGEPQLMSGKSTVEGSLPIRQSTSTLDTHVLKNDSMLQEQLSINTHTDLMDQT
jgi:hypothetical protein